MSVIGATRGPRDIERPAFPRVDAKNRWSQSTVSAVGDGGDLPPIGNGKSNADVPDQTVYLSPAARRLLDADGGAPSDATKDASTSAEKVLTKAELQEVEHLKARDAEVRVHEAAHAASAGGLAGRPSLDYATGPDGRRYAVAGEVQIDTSPGRTPRETITRARTIRAAATAPASPSAQDMAVAASASRMEAEAQREIAQLRDAESKPGPDATAAVARAEQAHSGADAQPASHDPDGTINVLLRERAQTLGGRGHTHADSGCGFCQGAARAYG